MKPVADALHKMADLHDERAAVYGDDYLHQGEVLRALFPRGLLLETAEDFGRFNILVHRMTKEVRYARAFKLGGHVDSLDDLSVYAQLAQHFDSVAREGGSRPVDAPQGESSPEDGRASPLAKEPASAFVTYTEDRVASGAVSPVDAEERAINMNHPIIEHTPADVTVEGETIRRPSRISAKQWLDFWEDVQTLAEGTYQDGYEKGFENGKETGKEEGEASGYERGKEEGIKEGRDVALASAIEKLEGERRR